MDMCSKNLTDDVKWIDMGHATQSATSVQFVQHTAGLQSRVMESCSAVSEPGAVAASDSLEILMVPGVHPLTPVPRRLDRKDTKWQPSA